MSGEEIENYDEEAEGENYYGEAEGEDGVVGEGEEPEGMFIIEGADGEIYMADELPNGQTLEEAMGHTNNTDEEEKKWSESGDNDFHVEDISIGQFREHNDHIYTIAQHPTLPHIFLSGGGDDRVLVWDTKGDEKDKNTLLEIKEGFKDSIEYIKFSSDGKYLLISGMGNPIRIYKVEEHEGIPSFEFKKEMETGDDISFINWHPKANLFLTGGNDMMVWMFNALNGEFTTYTGHEDAINNAEFTPDGKQIVSISNDQSVKVWNPRTTKCMQTIQGEMFHKNPIISMFMINQSIVTGDSEGYIYIAQYKTGETVGPVTKHSEAVESIKGNSPKSVA
jgi:ribosome assembly protein SQT1